MGNQSTTLTGNGPTDCRPHIRRIQAEVGVTPDGIAGPITWRAIHDRLFGTLPEQAPGARLDPRSEKNIASLLPQVQGLARELVQRCTAQGVNIRIIDGSRTPEEQDALYEQGRTKPGPIVTHARGGFSNHNFGIAFDIGVFVEGKYEREHFGYSVAGIAGEKLGLEWGGRWTSLPDAPHFQLRPRWAARLTPAHMLAELRRRHAIKQPIFT